MKLATITAIVLLVMIVSSVPAESGGRIVVVGTDTIDFGKYPAREKKIARYVLRNAGKTDLQIVKIRKTCGCSSATCDKTVLRPNETGIVEVVMLPHSLAGLYSKNTFVESSDAANRFLKLTVSGHAIPLIQIKPSHQVAAGRIKTGQRWSQSFALHASSSDVKLGKVKTTSTHPVKAVLSKQTNDDGNHPRKLLISLLPTKKSGDWRCTAMIPFLVPSNHPPLEITVTGRIGAELSAVPGIAYLSLSETPSKRSFRLRVLGQRSRVLKPDDIDLPVIDGIQFSVKQAPNRKGLILTTIFSPEFTRQLAVEERTPISVGISGASSATIVCKSKN